MTLDGVEFLRRFLQHVLPSGFVRIRHFGLLANRHREEKLTRCRLLLSATPAARNPEPPRPEPGEATKMESGPDDPAVAAPDSRVRCPVCGKGRMVVIEVLPRSDTRPPAVPAAVRDTS
jgi:hypothetical protein